MRVSEFRDAAIYSAQVYYQYLEDHGRGESSVGVREIRPVGRDSFRLTLSSRLSANAVSNLDSLQFRYNGHVRTAQQIQLVEYTHTNATLLVRPLPQFLPEVLVLKAEELTVFSDLKFLVKRVEDWYQNYGLQLIPPKYLRTNAAPDIFAVSNASDEQRTAIKGALTSPSSYIWGAPGTGKTRVVLASCVLSLLQAQKKVLIAAPTNNALEQVLLGLLPVLSEHNISLNQVLRLGTPTASFADRYPQVCERSGIDRQVAQTKAEIKKIRECLKFRASCRTFEDAAQQINPLCSQFLTACENAVREQEKIEHLTQSSAHLRADDVLLRREIDRILGELQCAQRALEAPGVAVWKHILRERYARLLADEDRAVASLQAKRTKLDYISEQLKNVSDRLDAHTALQKSFEAKAAEIQVKIIDLSSFWPDLQKAAEQLIFSDSGRSVENFLHCMRVGVQLIEEKLEKHSAYDSYSDEALTVTADRLSADIENLQTLTTEDRLAKASVVAVTLDKFITLGIPLPIFAPDHIFLDEAGYCSLIKGAPLFATGAPVTFLGDHMQLPPVCEMDVEGFFAESACLWSQSAIHLDTAFLAPLCRILQEYEESTDPLWIHVRKFDLNTTHRFSESLAKILASHVYSPEFHSAADNCTDLIVLDAPRRKESVPRTSAAEIETIAEYLRTEDIGDFAILTPYRKQISLLAKQFPTVHKDERILTVHSSQGREWDTVFFSVVDTSDMFFCNTRSPSTKGKQVVNTAVSRAKKRLVIVCDYDYWASQSNQLITDLILSAQKYDPTAELTDQLHLRL